MFRNYIKIGLRNLYKHPFYSGINITGLAAGIACVLFIILYVQDELSYDRFMDNSNRIYRVTSHLHLRGNDMNGVSAGGPVGKGIMDEFPEVENFTRIVNRGAHLISYNNIYYKEPNIFYADSTFFKVFDVPLLQGNKNDVLNAKDKIALSESVAKKYFGNDNPIGKILKIDEKKEYNVTGVFKDFPYNSHFHPGIIVAMASYSLSEHDLWTNGNFPTYLLLKPGTNYKQLEAKFRLLVTKYVYPEVQKFVGVLPKDIEASGIKISYGLQPLTDIHLYSHYPGEFEPNGDIKYAYIFSAIGLFILLLACINFVNLSTARSANRAKEVGVKKVVGSTRKDLIFQFLSESTIISFISAVLAIFIVEFLMPHFNNLAGKHIEFSYLTRPFTVGVVLFTILTTGILAGSFPAFVLSSFNPAVVLKGNFSIGKGKRFLRSGLVVFQFATSIILIVCTLVVFSQLNFIQNKKLGFNKENVLIVQDAYILGSNLDAFKNEILKNSNVLSGTISGYLPIESDRSDNGTFPDGRVDLKKLLPIGSWRIDYDYLKTMGMKLVEGRNFSRDFGADTASVIINQACAKAFGWENPLKHTVGRYHSSNAKDLRVYKIIGVVKDFNFESVKIRIEPLILYLGKSTSLASFRIKSAGVANTVSFIHKTWDRFAIGKPFNYEFMDQSFNAMYKSEDKVGNIFGTFAVIAVLIGCLGLFGLSAFTAAKKTKEIGIRKVHGATVKDIVILLSKEFAVLVSIAFIIAAPVAYYLMSRWLDDYAYRTNLSYWIFALSGMLALLIALLTVSYHAIKAALSNPAKSLKYE